MKQLEVQIMGQSYLLGCPENGDARLLEAVEKVDAAMCRIRDAGKIKARDRIAVLAALNLAFELPDRAATAAALQPADSAAQSPAIAQARPDEEPELTLLLQRLDAALSGDGQLL
ncbi:MAG: cell division protein ZapA [Comamonadaceae bacterium]|nr:MAG: cell division protein ZapA [Comamonadaceae bacterium]